jgi:nitrogen regulatory protein PII
MLYEHGGKMTTSAIGDNLVKKPFLKSFAKLTRNFIVHRGLSSRAMLESSKLNSEYIMNSIFFENRSVWIAQREGRTKDGNDCTQKGVLKMLSLACREAGRMADFFKHLKIVPVSISYENDPTDVLKMPELLAKSKAEIYVKGKNEDFKTVISGIMGQKKRIHIALGDVFDMEIDQIFASESSLNRQMSLLAEEIDKVIISNYQLWPTNYIALDMLNGSCEYNSQYTMEEKDDFESRLKRGVDLTNPIAVRNFLSMYANPVINKQKVLIT